jgi:hypothetical protein
LTEERSDTQSHFTSEPVISYILSPELYFKTKQTDFYLFLPRYYLYIIKKGNGIFPKKEIEKSGTSRVELVQLLQFTTTVVPFPFPSPSCLSSPCHSISLFTKDLLLKLHFRIKSYVSAMGPPDLKVKIQVFCFSSKSYFFWG